MKFNLLLIFLSLQFTQSAWATYVLGGTMGYKSLGNGKYLITSKIYRNCNGEALSNVKFSVFAGQNGGNSCGTYTLSGFKRVAINDITNRCSTSAKTCSPSNTKATGEGVEEHVYCDTLDFSKAPFTNFTGSSCCQYTFRTHVPQSLDFYTKTVDFNMFTMIDVCNISKVPFHNKSNSSPIFNHNFQFFLQCNQAYYEAQGALDTTEYDSLDFKLKAPMKSTPDSMWTNITPFSIRYFITPYCLPPGNVSCTPNINSKPPRGINFDSFSGDLVFTPTNCSEVAGRVVEVSEYRKDSSNRSVLVGMTMNVVVYNIVINGGYNKSPLLIGSAHSQVCAGDKICFKIYGTDEQFSPYQTIPDTVQMKWDKGIPGGVFKILNPGDREKTAEFCWQTTSADVRDNPWNFTVTANDQHCPKPALSSRTFRVTVRPPVVADTPVASIIQCRRLRLHSKSESMGKIKQSIIWTLSDSTGKVLSVTTRGIDTLDLNYYGKLYVKQTVQNKYCSKYYYDSLIVNPLPLLNMGNDTAVCTGVSVMFNPNVLNAENPIQYLWSFRSNGLQDTSPTFNLLFKVDTTLYLQVKEASGCLMKDSLHLRKLGHFSRIFTSPIPAICTYQKYTDLNLYTTQIEKKGNDSAWSTWSKIIVNNNGWKLYTGLVNNSEVIFGIPRKTKIYIQYSDIYGCTYLDSTNVTVAAPPMVETRNRSYCQSSQIAPMSDLIVRYHPKMVETDLSFHWKILSAPEKLDTSKLVVPSGFNSTYGYKLNIGTAHDSSHYGKYVLEYTILDKTVGCLGRDTSTVTVYPYYKTEIEDLPENCENNGNINLLPYVFLGGKPAKRGDVSFSVTSFNSDHNHVNCGKAKITDDTLLNARNIPGNWGITLTPKIIGCFEPQTLFHVIIHPNPTVDFSILPDTQITMANPVCFIENKSIAEGKYSRSKWTALGAELNNREIWNPEVSFPAPGIYSILLEITSGAGCSDTLSKMVSVKEKIVINPPKRISDTVNIKTFTWGSDEDYNNNQMIIGQEIKLNHLLQIICDNEITASLKIYDAIGKLVFTSSGNSGIAEFKGAQGIYFYSLHYTINGKAHHLTGKISISADK